jgi:hypothetical protein
MKTLAIAIVALAVGVSGASAGSVSGYYRSNGTYVAPHFQSNRDSTVTDNYSFRGNANPYTGRVGSNSYAHDLTSPYFNGTPYRNGHYGHSNGLF